MKAMVLLGIMYRRGDGVIKDAVEAYAWFNVVAEQRNKTAAEFRDRIKKTMTPDQITEIRKRSIEIIKSLPVISWKLFCWTVAQR